MAKLLQVALLGHPVLRQKAKEVQNARDPRVQSLIDDLLETVMDVNGVGMAAPQMYESLRLIIVASHPNPRYPNAPEMEPTPMINPTILSHSKEKKKDWEGCLSIPGIRGLIPRFTSIAIQYMDRSGKKVKGNFSDFIARIIQHEVDHLDGIMFLDRVENNREIISDKEYLKLIASKT
ncbi:peptide deformylase [Candidatus Gottesmanbacteria bacterium]|nr:peptide deformylase [Candidatus Gottesmanbacteria bacterium]